MPRHVFGSLSVVFVFLFVYCAAAGWLPSGGHGRALRSAVLAQDAGGVPRITTIDDAAREIRALEARSKGRHDHLLEDTKALAESYDELVHQNADRIAEIAALKREVADIRSELSALKAARK